jgi:hypothetical protein
LAEVNADAIARAAESERPSRLMGAFRTALAMAVLQEIKPDLVIFDEFQKFREILIDPPRVLPDPVAEALRGAADWVITRYFFFPQHHIDCIRPDRMRRPGYLIMMIFSSWCVSYFHPTRRSHCK